MLHVRTAMLEVKKGAITAIGELGAHTGASFCPYLESVMEVLQKAAGNWHPLVKSEVADALPNMIAPSIAAYHNGELKWTKGDISTPGQMSEHTSALSLAILRELVNLSKDDDKTTVAKAAEGMQSVIELCGPQSLVPVANECLSVAHELLTKTAPCFIGDEYDGYEEDDDDEHDLVTQAACDLIGGFCRVMGAQFAQYLPQFLPPACEYAKSSRPPRDRSMAIGFLSEVAQELDVSIMEYWSSVFLPLTLAGLGDPSLDVKRNAAFCAGVCCENLRERILGDYPQLLQAIEPLFGVDPADGESAEACLDNTAACLSRMIMAAPASMPMPQVLPAVLKLLPLKADMSENETVYNCLLGLIQVGHPDAMAQKMELRRIFSEATAPDSKVDNEIQEKLKQALALPALQ